MLAAVASGASRPGDAIRAAAEIIARAADAPDGSGWAGCAAMAAAAAGDAARTASALRRIAASDAELRGLGAVNPIVDGQIALRQSVFPWSNVAASPAVIDARARIEASLARLRAEAAAVLRGCRVPSAAPHHVREPLASMFDPDTTTATLRPGTGRPAARAATAGGARPFRHDALLLEEAADRVHDGRLGASTMRSTKRLARSNVMLSGSMCYAARPSASVGWTSTLDDAPGLERRVEGRRGLALDSHDSTAARKRPCREPRCRSRDPRRRPVRESRRPPASPRDLDGNRRRARDDVRVL